MKPKLFCNYCNSPIETEFIEGKDRQVCRKCGEIYYENPLPVASVIVANHKNELLLVKRARQPFKDMWCFPIGFAEVGESIENAATRELKEEAGIDGKITQIIDVDSHKNPIYGELIIISFEAEKIGGKEHAGDDASDYGYFSAMNLPKLAFDSQEKALEKYLHLKRDTWDIRDSFEKFFQETIEQNSFTTHDLISDELMDVIELNADKIVGLWINDILTNPSTSFCRSYNEKELLSTAMLVVGQLKAWIKGAKGDVEFKNFCLDLGVRTRRQGISLQELISSLNILKKHIFRFTYSQGLWYNLADIYRVFELGERLVHFFDKIVYYVINGYVNKCRKAK